MIRAVAAASLLSCAAVAAHAAGGHHAVDDATILDAGQCQVETWLARADDAAQLLHVGPACRVGPFELGVNLERQRIAEPATTAGVQAKWARPLAGGVGVGIVLAAAWRDGRAIDTVVAPLTWKIVPTLALHVNAGRDLRQHDRDVARAGVAAEWTPLPAWSFVAERYADSGADYRRAGVRWIQSPGFNVDLSRAGALGAGGASNWTLGLTWTLGPPAGR